MSITRLRTFNKKKWNDLGLYLAIGFACLVSVLPILYAFYISFLPKSEILGGKIISTSMTLSNYQEILALPQFFHSLKNSFVASFSATIIALALGAITAYALTRIPGTGGGGMAAFILVFRMLPGIALIVPSFLLFRQLRILDTPIALVLLYLTFSLPFAVWSLRGFLLSIPGELDEAAALDGCTRLGVIWYIILPVMRPAILATGVMVFMFCWNDFLFALIVTDQKALTFLPYMTRFILPNETLYGQIFAGATFFLLPVFIALVLLRRQISESFGLGIV